MKQGQAEQEETQREQDPPEPAEQEEAVMEENPDKEFTPDTAELAEFEEDLEPVGYAFECTVSKQGSSDWGWVLDQWEEACQVTKISGGSISDYNTSAPEGQKILQFDLVTQVNSARTSRGMVDEVKASNSLKLKVLRPALVNAKVSREGLPWGLELTYQQQSSVCLRVKKIEDGAVANENSKRSWPAVRENDFILRINGVSGTPKVLSEQLQSTTAADLVVLRRPPSASA